MLKFPCLVLDHDDTVVQSEATINYPYFVYILDRFRPGTTIALEQYVHGCSDLGFIRMCREWYHFTDEELAEEYRGWQNYILHHIPAPYPGMDRIIRRQKEAGGLVCVVSHSAYQNISRDYDVHFGLRPDDIYGWDLPEERRKPSPWSLEQIMTKYSLSSEQLLVLDDMKPAWEMCRKAAVPIAFAAWGKKDYPKIAEEMRSICDYSFETVEELEKFLFE